MGRLSPEIIEAAPQFLNPVGQYELSLRGKSKDSSFEENQSDLI